MTDESRRSGDAAMARLDTRMDGIEYWMKRLDCRMASLETTANMGKGAWIAILRMGAIVGAVAAGLAWVFEQGHK